MLVVIRLVYFLSRRFAVKKKKPISISQLETRAQLGYCSIREKNKVVAPPTIVFQIKYAAEHLSSEFIVSLNVQLDITLSSLSFQIPEPSTHP